MAVKTYRKTALVTAEQFLPAIGQIPKGVYSDGNGDPRKRLDCSWVLDTKEGRHTLRGGDYICTGPAGEQWNVAQEIFESTYEEISSAITPGTKDYRERIAVTQWQPIDTAPKDGTEFLGWFPCLKLDEDGDLTNEPVDEEPFGGRAIVSWEGGCWSEPDWLSASGDWFGDDFEYAPDPTLWQPLPAPPSITPDMGKEDGNV
jgi:hypothetical protein